MNSLKIYSFLFMLFFITSCSKENIETGEVPYAPCPCEEEKELTNLKIPMVRLFCLRIPYLNKFWFR